MRSLRRQGQLRGSGGPTDPPSRQRKSLATASERQRSFTHSGKRCHWYVLSVIVSEVLINFIRQRDYIMFLTELRNCFEFAAAEDFAGRIVRAVEQEHAGLARERGRQFVRVKGKVRRPERHDTWHRARHRKHAG